MSIFYEIEFAKYILPYLAVCDCGLRDALWASPTYPHYGGR